MQLDITAKTLAGGEQAIRCSAVPDVCPRCHRSVHPKHVYAALLSELGQAQVVFRCTHQKCQELFLGTYSTANRSSAGRSEYTLRSVTPATAQKTSFPETVLLLSPTFVSIYDQSQEAETRQLDQLVGIGLRKALEFLVKDYAASENPGKDDEIRTSTLASCIAQYVSDPNVKECAKRAAWLGNDETHYTRKWETKDVGDLKLLVRLTVNWIDNSLLTKKYMAEMNAGRA